MKLYLLLYMHSELLEGIDLFSDKKKLKSSFENYTGYPYSILKAEDTNNEEYQYFYHSDTGATKVIPFNLDLPNIKKEKSIKIL